MAPELMRPRHARPPRAKLATCHTSGEINAAWRGDRNDRSPDSTQPGSGHRAMSGSDKCRPKGCLVSHMKPSSKNNLEGQSPRMVKPQLEELPSLDPRGAAWKRVPARGEQDPAGPRGTERGLATAAQPGPAAET